MRNLKEGDVVELKSGSLPMTIKSIGTFNGKEQAVCNWCNKNDKLETARFFEHELTLVRSGDSQ